MLLEVKAVLFLRRQALHLHFRLGEPVYIDCRK
jgi:hypothetical protein